MKVDRKNLGELSQAAAFSRDQEISELGRIQKEIEELKADSIKLRQELRSHLGISDKTEHQPTSISFTHVDKWKNWVEQQLIHKQQRIAILRVQAETQLKKTRYSFGRAAVLGALMSRTKGRSGH